MRLPGWLQNALHGTSFRHRESRRGEFVELFLSRLEDRRVLNAAPVADTEDGAEAVEDLGTIQIDTDLSTQADDGEATWLVKNDTTAAHRADQALEKAAGFAASLQAELQAALAAPTQNSTHSTGNSAPEQAEPVEVTTDVTTDLYASQEVEDATADFLISVDTAASHAGPSTTEQTSPEQESADSLTNQVTTEVTSPQTTPEAGSSTESDTTSAAADSVETELAANDLTSGQQDVADAPAADSLTSSETSSESTGDNTPGENTDGSPGTQSASQETDSTTDSSPAPLATATTQATLLSEPQTTDSTDQAEAGHEVIFVDYRVSDWQSLVGQVDADTEVIILEAGRDGVDQIADALEGRDDISAVHIVSHGAAGRVYLGSTVLSGDNLASYASAWETVGGALTENADILFYGCNVAEGAAGAAFLSDLSRATGADTAGSTDNTGNAAYGGDWQLEAATGSIEAALVGTTESRAGYAGLLETIVVTNSSDTVSLDADLDNPLDLIASGGGLDGISLREAIIAANNTPEADIITFHSSVEGTTITLTGTSGEDAAATGDLDLTTDITIDGGTDGVGINANSIDRVFDIHTGATVVMTNLLITGGDVTGDGGGIQITDAGLTLQMSTVDGNDATVNGGGIAVTGGNLILTSSLVQNNSADSGGGVFFNTPGATTATGSVTSSRITGNTAEGQGGGLYTSNASVQFSASVIDNNTANTMQGGGVYVAGALADLTAVNTTISRNQADDSTSGGGGGLYIDSGTVTLTHVTIAENTSAGPGTGTLHNAGGTVNATNTLISNNTGANTAGSGINGTNTANLIANVGGLLATLADNGGPSVGSTLNQGVLQSHLPQGGSAITDSGVDLSGIVDTDQRGIARPLGPGYDVGAVEAQYTVTTISFAGDVLSIADNGGVAIDDSLTLSFDDTTNVLTITDANNTLDFSAIAGAGVSGDASSVSIDLDLFTGTIDEIQVNGNGGDDSLNIDFSSGDFLAANGITLSYTGGDTDETATGDSITVSGGTFTSLTYNITGDGAGNFLFDGTQSIQFVGLEPATVTSVAGTVTINIDDGNLTADEALATVITDGGDATDGMLFLDAPGAAEDLLFAAPTVELIINGDVDDADTITIDSVDDGNGNANDFRAAVTINGRHGAGQDPTVLDTVNINTDLTLGSAVTGNTGNLTVDADTIVFAGSTVVNTTAATTGNVNLTAARNIVLNSGSGITTLDGTITLEANTAGTATGNFIGISLNNADLITGGVSNGGGLISLEGQGGDTGSDNIGVQLLNGSTIRSTGTDDSDLGRVAAGITILGTGGVGDDNNFGVSILNSTTLVTSIDGDISISGIGGSNSTSGSNGNYGVDLRGGADIRSTGTNSATGTAARITIDGTGGAGEDSNYGVGIASTGTEVTSIDGNISITGQGGSNGQTGSNGNYGVSISSGADIISTGFDSATSSAALITIHGTGGAGDGSNSGVIISTAGTTVTSADGDISITGFGGADLDTDGVGPDVAAGGDGNYGVLIGVEAVVSSTGSDVPVDSRTAARITIAGTGGPGINANIGVGLISTDTEVTSLDGDISITGTGQGSGNLNFGVQVASGATVTSQTGGAATITVNGSGAAGADGVQLNGSTEAALVSDTTAITVNALAGDFNMANNARIESSSGTIELNSVDDVHLGAVNADIDDTGAAGTVLVTADSDTGGIFDVLSTEAANITAASAALRAGSGIGTDAADADIDIEVTTLAFVNTTSGEVVITDLADGLIIDDVDGITTSSNVNGGGTIAAASPMTVSHNTTYGGNTTLTAGNDSGTAGDDFTIRDGAIITLDSDTDATLTINAGDNIVFGSTDPTTGQIVTQGDGTHTVQLLADREDDDTDSAGGSVTQVDDTFTAVTTDNLVIAARTGVGSSSTPLETAVADLDITNTTDGGIFIAETDAVSISQIDQQGADDVTTVTAGGTITVTGDGTGGNNIGITAGSGTVTLTATGTSSDVVLEDEIVTAGGNVDLLAGNDISSTAAGTITTTAAANSGVASGAVTIRSAQDTSGSIDLDGSIDTSGADNATGTASAGGLVTLDADDNSGGNVSAANILTSGGTGTAGQDGGAAGDINVNSTTAVTLNGTWTALGGAGTTPGTDGLVTIDSTGGGVIDGSGSEDPNIEAGSLDIDVVGDIGGNTVAEDDIDVRLSGTASLIATGSDIFMSSDEDLTIYELETEAGEADTIEISTTGSANLTIHGTYTAIGTDLVTFSTVNGGLNVTGSLLSVGTLDLVTSGTGVLTGSANMSTSGGLTANVGGASTITGTISGSGGLTKQGGAALGLNAANSYGGGTSIEDGTLRNDAAGVLPDGTTVGVASGATWDLNGFSETIAGLTGSGTVTNADASGSDVELTVGSGDVSSTFDGVIEDNDGAPSTLELTKIGDGVFTLTGDSTYDGDTNVNGGTLIVDGTIDTGETSSATVEVNTGATLGGNGTINNIVNVNDGGTLSPGNSDIDTLSSESITFDAGSTFEVEIIDANAGGATAGVDYDQQDVTGSVTIDTTGDGSTLDLATTGSTDIAAGDEYIIILNEGDANDSNPVTGFFSAPVLNGVAITGDDLADGELNEGDILSTDFGGSGFTARITYQGGDGNDVAILVDGPISVSAAGITVVDRVDGTDSIRILNAANTPTLLAEALAGNFANFTVVNTRPINSINTGGIIITGGAADDILIVDLDGFNDETIGAANFTGIISFNGMGESTGDSLYINDPLFAADASTGTPYYMVSHSFTDADSGTVSIDRNAGNTFEAFTISYDGIEPIVQTMDAQFVVLSYNSPALNAINQSITVRQDLNDSTLTEVRSEDGSNNLVAETLSFINPSEQLVIVAGDGDDTIVVEGFGVASDPVGRDFVASLGIDGGLGTDSIELTTDLTLGSTASEGNVDFAAEAITLSGSIDTTAADTGNAAEGDVTLNAGTTITVAAGETIDTEEGDVRFTAGRNIVMNSGSAITTLNGDIALAANRRVFAATVASVNDEDTLTITNAAGDTLVIEFDDDATQEVPGSVVLDMTGLTTNAELAEAIVDLINLQLGFGAVWESGTNQFQVELAREVLASNTVALTEQAGASGNFIGISLNNADLTTGDATNGGGEITLDGRGGDTGNDNVGVELQNGSTVNSTSTDDTGVPRVASGITILGTGGPSEDDNIGVVVAGTDTVVSTVDGDLIIVGTGGSNQTTGSDSNHGVQILGAAAVRSTGTGSDAGTITILGTGGAGEDINLGVHMSGSASLTDGVTSVDGDISITGFGGSNGAAGSNNNDGIRILSASQVVSSGTGNDAATITISGTGGAGDSVNIGVLIQNTDTLVTSHDGDIAITGTGGADLDTDGAGSDVANGGVGNRGVLITTGAVVSSTGTDSIPDLAATITVTGTGGAGTQFNDGVSISGIGGNAGSVTSLDGDILITGTGQGTGASNFGTVISNDATVVSQDTGTATITVNGTGAAGADGVRLSGDTVATLVSDTAEITVNSLAGDLNMTGDARIETDSGTVRLNSVDDVHLGTVNADLDADGTSSTVFVTADSDDDGAGAITDNLSTEDANIIAESAALRAGSGIGVGTPGEVGADDINTETLTGAGATFTLAAETVWGDIHVRNDGSLTIGTVAAATADELIGVTITDNVAAPFTGSHTEDSGNDDISLIAASPEIIDAPVINRDGGDINLTSLTSGNVEINANVQVTSEAGAGLAGSITVTAEGGNIIHNMGTVSTVGGSTTAGDGTIRYYAEETLRVGDDTADNTRAIVRTAGGNIDLDATPSVAVTVSGTAVTLSDEDGDLANPDASGNENVLVQTVTGNITIDGTGISDGSADGNVGVLIDSGTVVRSTGTESGAEIGSITINGTGGVSEDANAGVRIDGLGTQVISVDGDIFITGQGGSSGVANSLANSGVEIIYGAKVSSTGIDDTASGRTAALITLDGTAGAGEDINRGVVIFGTGTEVISVDGDISITGVGGSNGEAGSIENYGVDIRGEAVVSSTGTDSSTGTAALITIHGTGGAGSDENFGVNIEGDDTLVTSVDGDISITGIGGADLDDDGIGADVANGDDLNSGVVIHDGAVVSSTGMDDDADRTAALITIDGTGGAGDDFNHGVLITDLNTEITSIDGDISITGQGGSSGAAGSNNNYGVQITAEAVVSSTGADIPADGRTAALITIDGTGGAGDNANFGVNIEGAVAEVTSVDGDISITGIGGADPANGDHSNAGVAIRNEAVVSSTGTGMTAARITIDGTGHGSGASNVGTVISGTDTRVTSIDGDVTIVGVGGQVSSGTDDFGVFIASSAEVDITGSADVIINGTAGANTDEGVLITGGAIIGDTDPTANADDATGNIILDANAGLLSLDNATVRTTAADGTTRRIVLSADTIVLADSLVQVLSAGTGLAEIVAAPDSGQTVNVELGTGASDGNGFALDETELNQLEAGVIRIGSADILAPGNTPMLTTDIAVSGTQQSLIRGFATDNGETNLDQPFAFGTSSTIAIVGAFTPDAEFAPQLFQLRTNGTTGDRAIEINGDLDLAANSPGRHFEAYAGRLISQAGDVEVLTGSATGQDDKALVDLDVLDGDVHYRSGRIIRMSANASITTLDGEQTLAAFQPVFFASLADTADEDTITVTALDGTVLTFEFDSNSTLNDNSNIRIDLTGVTNNAQLAAAIAAAIDGQAGFSAAQQENSSLLIIEPAASVDISGAAGLTDVVNEETSFLANRGSTDDEDTITLTAPDGTVRVFEFDNDSSLTDVSHIAIDLTGIVTDEELATAIVMAINSEAGFHAEQEAGSNEFAIDPAIEVTVSDPAAVTRVIAPVDNFTGITLTDADLLTGDAGNNVGGDILLLGRGGDTGSNNVGILIEGDSTITSDGTGAMAGNITLVGVGGPGEDDNEGVNIQGTDTLITSVDGGITIVGTGGSDGSSDSDSNEGVLVALGAEVRSTGTGNDAATITVRGTGGNGNDFNRGVAIGSGGTLVTSVEGDISVTGVGGTNSDITSSFNDGVQIANAAQVTSTGTDDEVAGNTAATITITGTGRGTNSNDGVNISGFTAGTPTTVTSVDGAIVITGVSEGTEIGNGGVTIGGGAEVSSTGMDVVGERTAATITIDGTGSGTDANEGVQISGTNGAGTSTTVTSIDGDISITGQSTGTATANRGVVIATGAQVTSTGTDDEVAGSTAATITIDGTGSGTSNGKGVHITGNSAGVSTTVASIDGDISITGESTGSGSDNEGVEISAGAVVESTGTDVAGERTAAEITIDGTGSGTDDSEGVLITGTDGNGTSTTVTSLEGNISITGGSTASGIDNAGVEVSDQAAVTSTGTDADAAHIEITGTGGAGEDDNHGVLITDAGTNLTADTGNIQIVGTGGSNGTGTSERNTGVQIAASAVVETTTTDRDGGTQGTVNIVGTGAGPAGNDNHDVQIDGPDTHVRTLNGNINVAGIAGDVVMSNAESDLGNPADNCGQISSVDGRITITAANDILLGVVNLHGGVFRSADVPQAFTDATDVDGAIDAVSTIEIGSSLLITDLNVELTIEHGRVEDLAISLLAPDGTTRVDLVLAADLTGADLTGTVLDDEADTALTAGAAPFTGRFVPAGSLADFDGLDAQGTWTLEITDTAAGEGGTLLDWSLKLTGEAGLETGTFIADLGFADADAAQAAFATDTTAVDLQGAGTSNGTGAILDNRMGGISSSSIDHRPNVLGGPAVFIAGSGIGNNGNGSVGSDGRIQTEITNLEGQTDTGGIVIDNLGDLVIGGIDDGIDAGLVDNDPYDTDLPVALTTGTGDIEIVTGSSLTVADPITNPGGGTTSLTAFGTNFDLESLILTAGNIDLFSGGFLNIDSPGQTQVTGGGSQITGEAFGFVQTDPLGGADHSTHTSTTGIVSFVPVEQSGRNFATTQIDQLGRGTVTFDLGVPGVETNFSIVIDWGDGSTEAFNVNAGSFSFTHQYLANPNQNSAAPIDFSIFMANDPNVNFFDSRGNLNEFTFDLQFEVPGSGFGAIQVQPTTVIPELPDPGNVTRSAVLDTTTVVSQSQNSEGGAGSSSEEVDEERQIILRWLTVDGSRVIDEIALTEDQLNNLAPLLASLENGLYHVIIKEPGEERERIARRFIKIGDDIRDVGEDDPDQESREDGFQQSAVNGEAELEQAGIDRFWEMWADGKLTDQQADAVLAPVRLEMQDSPDDPDGSEKFEPEQQDHLESDQVPAEKGSRQSALSPAARGMLAAGAGLLATVRPGLHEARTDERAARMATASPSRFSRLWRRGTGRKAR